MHAERPANAMLSQGYILDAHSLVKITYIYVLGQQFVGHSVFIKDVVVGTGGCEGGAEEEAK